MTSSVSRRCYWSRYEDEKCTKTLYEMHGAKLHAYIAMVYYRTILVYVKKNIISANRRFPMLIFSKNTIFFFCKFNWKSKKYLSNYGQWEGNGTF